MDLSAKNSRLAFDSSILLPKNLQYQPKENLKLIYKIKNEIKNIFEDKRAVTKILKMDENNQYGNVMAKPLQTGSIKRAKKFPTMKEFDLILQGISDEDKIGHLFIVDTEFDQKNASEEQLSFKEIYTLIYEKKKILPANERSAFQLLDAMRLNDKATINYYKTTAKPHATIDKK